MADGNPFDTSEFEAFLAVYPHAVRELALAARLRLHAIAGPASDLIFDATSAVCAGLSYSHNWRDGFVNIAVYPKHITLVFAWGVRLDDPEGRLKGEGKQVRHLRLAGIDTLHDPYVVGLIRQAATQAVRPDPPLDPVKIVKVYAGPKRR
ncbi:MAG TPA: DUF1801 domain-containing protein [Fimbriimonadaceae bacterium]|nr:DUF1801 domain-containing protein [Fimbriimonadaceae bacterium]